MHVSALLASIPIAYDAARAMKAYPRTYQIARPLDRSCLSCLSTVVPHTADPLMRLLHPTVFVA